MALRQLRSAARTWVASVIIGALILAFALWGVNDIFTGTVNTTVAEVGDTTISVTDYDRELKNRISTIAQQMKMDFTLEQARETGVDRAVLDNMIARGALDEETQRLGLTASDVAVSAEIRANSGLTGPDGAFDRGAFQRMLQENGLTEAFYVDATRQEMARNQMLSAVMDGTAAPSRLSQLFYAFVSETRGVEYLALTESDAGSVPEPTDAQLAEYHKAHADAFSTPEYRTIEYVAIGADSASGEVTVTDEEIKQEYEANKANYEKAETRDVEQIAFASKAEADAAHAKLTTDGSFTALAAEKGLKDADVKLGTLPKSGLDPKLADAVFAVAEGGITAPVEGPFGWVILRAAKVNPGESKPFEELTETLRANLVKAKAIGRVAEIANAFEDARAGGAALPDAAKTQGLTVHSIAAVERSGLTPDGAKAALPAAPAFLERVFATESGEESDLFESEDGTYYAVKIAGVTPTALKPLDQVRDAVRAGWISEAKGKALEARVQQLAAQAGKAGTLAQASAALGRSPSVSTDMRRDQPNETFGTPVLSQVFSVPQGGVVFGPGAKAGTYLIARVTSVTHKQPDTTSAEYAQFRQSMGQQLGEDLVAGVINAAKKRARVSINEKTLQSVTGEVQ